MPVSTSRVEPHHFTLRVDSVDVGAVRRGKRCQLSLRGLADVLFSQIDPAGRSFGVDEGNGAVVRIEGEDTLDRRRLVDGPDHRIELGPDVDTTASSSAWDAKEELVGALTFCYLNIGAVG